MDNRKSDTLAIVVISCDKYRDLWDPFFYFFNKYWLDCPYKLYLISNYEECHIKGVKSIMVGEDISWSDNLISALQHVNEDNCFFFLDDLFLCNHVNTGYIKMLYNEFRKLNGNYLKLIPMPKPDIKTNDIFGEISVGSLYRATAVFSIWKKEILIDLLRTGENAWEFEDKGTIRSDKFKGFYSTYEDSLNYIHGVIRGKWIKKSLELIKQDGYNIDTNRDIITGNLRGKILFREFRHMMFKYLVPSIYRRRVKSIVTRSK